MKEFDTVLTIAGSDSGGGAGVQADIKTITSLGCFATSVITSLTAQNSVGVQAIEPVPSRFVSQQIQSVLSDIVIKSIKIGMLHNEDVINAVADQLTQVKDIPLVLDPVMVATSKDILLEKKAIELLINKLFPLSLLVTPNIHEAEVLTGSSITNIDETKMACRNIQEMQAKNVLIKGGDVNSSESLDVLLTQNNEFMFFKKKKIQTKNTHGTGCSFSSAIACYLAKGHSLIDSIKRAKDYITNAIKAGASFKLGAGNGPINHMWEIHHEK